jgi:hypothetical protein
MDDGEAEPPAPRSITQVFNDLRVLAQTDGALHEVSGLVYRDWTLTFDTKAGRVLDAPEHRWSTSKLNKNEFLLLLGLMVQSTSDRTYTVETLEGTFAHRADQLLNELHTRVLADVASTFDSTDGTFVKNPHSVGLLAREAIYYGPESFYLHQLLRFGRQRYRNDATWLLQNAGLSIRPIIDIAKYLADQISSQMTAMLQHRETRETSNGELTYSLLVRKADVRKKFGAKADAFFKKFATSATGANASFVNPFAINAISISPVIDIGENLYVPNPYRLFESVYESPFYWMIADQAYRETAAKNRGAFLEKATADTLRAVFGSENVYENATLKQHRRGVTREIDVLVVYGEFVIVAQVKSKRITLKARAGDSEALRSDFDGAIQAPYQQALECIELIKSGAEWLTKDGRDLAFHSLPRFFPMVILSDPFPASTLLSQNMLARGDDIAPVIWDIAILDCVKRLLPTPIEMLFYLKSRSDVFERIQSDREYNYLGYHLQSKLVLPADANFMLLDRDFAGIVDDYMMAVDLGIEAKRPVGILERSRIPVICELLDELKTADPQMASVVIDLYDFSSAALKHLSSLILDIRKEIAATGKAIKAFSIPTSTGGITYAVTRLLDSNAKPAAHAIGAKHKYDAKKDRWYVILDGIETTNPIDGLLPLIWPWKEDNDQAVASQQVARMFKSRREAVSIASDDPRRSGVDEDQ